jgi:hypothetical protein
MFRISDPRSFSEQVEGLSTDQLFRLFEYFSKAPSAKVTSGDFAEAWGHLFSGVYLSAGGMVHGMQAGEHLLGKDRERVLREFIRADCRRGGAFVLEVICKGGNIDRAALIMIADFADLAIVEHKGTTALHLLAGACDRTVRPALIGQAGKKDLCGLYDARGVPVLFTILALNDLTLDDLNAIGKVFSRDDLRSVKTRNRAGRTGLEVYSEAMKRLKKHPSGERNAFEINRAVKSTNNQGNIKSQMNSGGTRGLDSHRSGTDIMGESRHDKNVDAGTSDVSERYRDMMANPLDNIRELVQRKPGPK